MSNMCSGDADAAGPQTLPEGEMAWIPNTVHLARYQEELPMAKAGNEAGDQLTQDSVEVSWAGHSRFHSRSESVLLSFKVILSTMGYVYI